MFLAICAEWPIKGCFMSAAQNWKDTTVHMHELHIGVRDVHSPRGHQPPLDTLSTLWHLVDTYCFLTHRHVETRHLSRTSYTDSRVFEGVIINTRIQIETICKQINAVQPYKCLLRHKVIKRRKAVILFIKNSLKALLKGLYWRACMKVIY